MKKYIYGVFCLLIVTLILQTPWSVFVSKKNVGWDHEIYCRASQVLNEGKDPYLVENLGGTLSYTYPVPFLKIYAPLCSQGVRTYIGVHFLLLAAICGLLIHFLKTDALLTAAWIFFGFNAAYSNYTTGNIGVFEAFFFTLFLILYEKRFWWSSLFLAPSAFLKVLPLVMIGPAVTLQKRYQWRWALAFLIVFCGALVALHSWSFWLSPELETSFFKQLLGLHGAQHSAIAESDSNPSNWAIPLFLKNSAQLLIQGPSWFFLFIFFILALFGFSVWLWRREVFREKKSLIAICWAYLILILWLPRLKPYSLLLVCILILPILKNRSRAWSWGLLILSIFHRSLNGDKSPVWLDFLSNNTGIYTLLIVLTALTLSAPLTKKELQ